MNDRDSGPILLTGATGQIGSLLVGNLAPCGHVLAPSRNELDLSRPESVRQMIRTFRPRWIVNAGAYTAVDAAESHSELAYATNSESVGAMGEEAREIGAVVIHVSTDYVFSGEGTAAYLETDVAAPINVYGGSKLAGEQALIASGAAHLIFRTSWVYGATGKNFLLTILKLSRERETLRLVADQHGAPTASRDLALLIPSVITRIERESASEGRPLAGVAAASSGIYHAAGTGETTWHGFASEALHQIRAKTPGKTLASLEAITTSEYPTPARRPLNSRLDCDKLYRTFGWKMPAWQQSLQRVLNELTSGQTG